MKVFNLFFIVILFLFMSCNENNKDVSGKNKITDVDDTSISDLKKSEISILKNDIDWYVMTNCGIMAEINDSTYISAYNVFDPEFCGKKTSQKIHVYGQESHEIRGHLYYNKLMLSYEEPLPFCPFIFKMDFLKGINISKPIDVSSFYTETYGDRDVNIYFFENNKRYDTQGAMPSDYEIQDNSFSHLEIKTVNGKRISGHLSANLFFKHKKTENIEEYTISVKFKNIFLRYLLE